MAKRKPSASPPGALDSTPKVWEIVADTYEQAAAAAKWCYLKEGEWVWVGPKSLIPGAV